jgi:hypothetical protein
MRAIKSSSHLGITAWLVLAALAVMLAACSKEPTAPAPTPAQPAANNFPEIMSLTANPAQIPVGRNADVIADARDPDNDQLTYEWRADLGAIFGDGSRVVYASGGCCAGTDRVYLTVRDGRGGSASADVTIEVTP